MNVVHDKSRKGFYIALGSEEAVLSYDVPESGIYDLYRTYVPDTGRGQGVAKKLVDRAVDYIKSHNGKVRPTCSYVAKYFEKYPENRDLLEPNN